MEIQPSLMVAYIFLVGSTCHQNVHLLLKLMVLHHVYISLGLHRQIFLIHVMQMAEPGTEMALQPLMNPRGKFPLYVGRTF